MTNSASSYSLQKLQNQALQIGAYIIPVIIISNYFSTALTTVSTISLGVIWLITAQFMKLPQQLKSQPVALWSLLSFAVFVLGLTYSSAASNAAFSMLGKYKELFYLPILLTFLTSERSRQWAWAAFTVASIVNLLISYIQFFGFLPLNVFGDASLKSHITHSLLVAFFSFYCAQKSVTHDRYRKLYLILLVISIHNQFLVVEGRSGQFVFLALTLLFAWQRFHKKYFLITIGVLALAMTLFISFSDKAQRLNQAFIDTQAYLQNSSALENAKSPMGQRYMFWANSVKLIAEKPLFGHGTGSFSQEYQRIAAHDPVLTDNPHNEFLMIAEQLGLFGLVVYLGFLGSQLSISRRLPQPSQFLAQGLLLSLMIISFFNCPIMDNTEGHWFITLIALCFAAKPCNPAYAHD